MAEQVRAEVEKKGCQYRIKLTITGRRFPDYLDGCYNKKIADILCNRINFPSERRIENVNKQMEKLRQENAKLREELK